MKRRTVKVTIDEKSFSRFASFDLMRHQKRWRQPALFSAILLAAALLCFSMYGSREGALLPGIVLLLIGLGLPAVYFGSFRSSVRRQCQRMKLARPAHVYDVTFSGREDLLFLPADGKGRAERFPWAEICCAYHTRSAVYLYVTPKRALLFPEGGIDWTLEELWAFLSEELPGEKLRG